ncbi:cuticle protein 10.9-like [Haemaphysalis longicornis]
MIAKAVILVSAIACALSENRFGGGGGGGFQSGGYSAGGGGASGPPQPYSFGYDTTDEFGTQLFHKEQGDASNAKTGSYGYRDANGIYRTVTYVADANGFRATIDTNEPGTAPGSSADAVFNAKPVAAGAGAGKVAPGRYTGSRPAAGGAGGPWAG